MIVFHNKWLIFLNLSLVLDLITLSKWTKYFQQS